MPFIGSKAKPKPTGHECDTPWWTWFIKPDTLWQCDHCRVVWILDYYDMGHSEGKVWIEYLGNK